jgi:hypothetical protein
MSTTQVTQPKTDRRGNRSIVYQYHSHAFDRLGLGRRDYKRLPRTRRSHERGMAIAQKWLVTRYNRSDFEIFDYNSYAVCGDGCMMEGIASEAASLGGHLGLDNFCWIYDNNHITIEGSIA